MDAFSIRKCLESMEIVVDTREQDTPRARERYSRFGVPYYRTAMDFGDYTYDFIRPDGNRLRNTEETIIPEVVIERKMNLDELAMCFGHDRGRFQREFERARENGSKVYLLVENATWENLLNGKYRSKLNKKAYEASIIAWMARYNITPIFCKAETSGELIKEILYRELKERLEGGYYDTGG